MPLLAPVQGLHPFYKVEKRGPKELKSSLKIVQVSSPAATHTQDQPDLRLPASVAHLPLCAPTRNCTVTSRTPGVRSANSLAFCSPEETPIRLRG